MCRMRGCLPGAQTCPRAVDVSALETGFVSGRIGRSQTWRMLAFWVFSFTSFMVTNKLPKLSFVGSGSLQILIENLKLSYLIDNIRC